MTNRPLRIAQLLGPFALAAVMAAAGCSSDSPTRVEPDPAPVGEDVTPPQQVADPVLDYPVAGGVATLSWIAPRDDDDTDRVASYDIRYSYSFPLDWNLSLRASTPPTPAVAGTPQSYEFPGVTRGRDLYAAIRSVDAAGNLSPISNLAHVRILGHTLRATCIDAISGQPVQGLDVLLTSLHVYPSITDAAGGFSQGDLATGSVNVALRYGTSGTPYHDINHVFALSADTDILYKMVPFEETDLSVYGSTFSMFRAAAGLEGTRKIFKKWRSLPVPIYIPQLVNSKGLDYHAIAVSAMNRWEELTGIDLWEPVDTPPISGVTLAFKTRAEMTPQVGITFHENDAEDYPLRDDVDIVDDFGGYTPLHTTMLHELGHTIRLGHLASGYLMFAGQPLPPDPTPDEVRVVQLYSSLPNGLDISIYDGADPRP